MSTSDESTSARRIYQRRINKLNVLGCWGNYLLRQAKYIVDRLSDPSTLESYVRTASRTAHLCTQVDKDINHTGRLPAPFLDGETSYPNNLGNVISYIISAHVSTGQRVDTAQFVAVKCDQCNSTTQQQIDIPFQISPSSSNGISTSGLTLILPQLGL
eukprot:9468366-Pyramimonas_sp.AAC.1